MKNLFYCCLMLLCSTHFLQAQENPPQSEEEMRAMMRRMGIDPDSGPQVGDQLSTFTATTIDGTTIDIEKLRGKVLLLNFWFIDCPPCQAEIPAFNKLVKKYADNPDFQLITFALDSKEDLESRMLKRKELSFPIVPKASPIIKDILDYKGGYPSTYLVGKDGVVKQHYMGGAKDEQEAEAHILMDWVKEIDAELNND